MLKSFMDSIIPKIDEYTEGGVILSSPMSSKLTQWGDLQVAVSRLKITGWGMGGGVIQNV